MGDPDKDLLPEEDEDGEDDPWQVTAEELRRLRTLGRKPQLAQQPGETPVQEAEDEQPAADGSLNPPLSPVPPWPTPRSADTSAAAGEGSRPLTPPPPSPPLATSTPAVAAAPARRHTAPFAVPPGQSLASARPGAARAGALPGWQSFRRHSHWLVPVVLVVVFFLLVLLTSPRQAGGMLFIFAAIGVLQAAVLLYAPSDAFWVVGVVAGVLIFLSATFFVLFLPIFALVLSILLLSLGGVALRERYYPVKEGTVAVMSFLGRYNRTLQPGFNLRVPGEKVLGIVETGRIRYEARIPPITLVSGEQVTLSVAVTYQVIPGAEHLAILQTKDWQKPIQQQLQAVVQDVISVLSIDDFRPSGVYPPPGAYSAYGADESDAGQEASPLERINERLTEAMSEQVADRGVAVHAVRVHLLESPHLPGSAQTAGQQAPSPPPMAALSGLGQGAGQGADPPLQEAARASAPLYPAAPAGLAGQPGVPAYPSGPPVASPPAKSAVPPPGAPPERMTLLSAQALAETYDAVVRQRITDPATIRRIISQFEAVAADPELSQQVPFDAEAGALNLMNHLRHLQARSQAQAQAQAAPAQPPGVSAFPPPDVPAAPEDK